MDDSREALLGGRGRAAAGAVSVGQTGAGQGEDFGQRGRLLAGTQRLEDSSRRLQESQRVAIETETIGAGILTDLHSQREQIVNTRNTLMEADSYVDKSMRTLKGMARRIMTNKIITAAIIAILILLILFVLYSKLT